jgi:hypothetical protein
MSGVGEALAIGILAGLVVEAIKSIRSLARELRNADEELAALSLQLEQKFPTFEDIEVLYKQEVFKNKVLPRDCSILDLSLRHVLWLLEQIDELDMLPSAKEQDGEGGKEAVGVDGE